MEETTTPRLKTLKNGAVYDLDKGRIVSGKGITNKITSATASDYNRKRQEKAARLLRARIAEETGKVSTLPIRDGAEAVAEAGALIWSETVLGQDVYPRDRLEAWERIGKYAGILQPPGQTQTQSLPAAGAGRVDAVVMLLLRKVDSDADIIDVASQDAGDSGGG